MSLTPHQEQLLRNVAAQFETTEAIERKATIYTAASVLAIAASRVLDADEAGDSGAQSEEWTDAMLELANAGYAVMTALDSSIPLAPTATALAPIDPLSDLACAARSLLMEVDQQRGRKIDGGTVLDPLHPICIMAESLRMALPALPAPPKPPVGKCSKCDLPDDDFCGRGDCPQMPF